MPIDIQEVLDLIEASLPTMVWRRDPEWKGFEAYMGLSAEWSGTVVRFKFGDRHGYDGTMTNLRQGLVVHLPPSLAEKAFRAASEQESDRD
jgi:hypothetical protein